MMQRIPFDEGRVVRSLQGRDAGRYFVVIHVVDEQFVMVSDGRTHKLSHLKKKKIKHLKPKPMRMDSLESLTNSNTLQDASIRRFLETCGFGLNEPLCKEDE